MNEAPFSVERIISSKQRFRVPIYQRLFVWEYAQIYQLLVDLYTALHGEKPDKPYYIGVITVKARVDGEWEVVDGQQRITFLTLLGCELGWKDFVFAENSGEDLRITYTGRDQDQADIKSYFESKSSQSIKNQNFAAFHFAFEEFKSKFLCNDDLADQYSDFVQENCQFLVNQLPDNYGPFELNLYFEKMNSTGRQLTPVECIKGKYFPQYASIWNACMDFDKALDPAIKVDSSGVENSGLTLQKFLEDPSSYKKPTNDDLEKIYSDRLIMPPEVLLLHVLSLLTGNDISLDKAKIIETFNRVGDFDRKRFVEKLIAYRLWLDANVIYMKNDNGTYHYQFRSDNDEAETNEKKTNEKKKLRQLQSMLYVSSSDFQEWVLKAYQAADNGVLTLTIDILEREINEKHLPDASLMKYHAIDRYWFWRLDYILWEQFVFDRKKFNLDFSEEEAQAIEHYEFRQNRSIEHLHPQTDGGQAEWDKVKHCFGNLAMISSSFNSLQHNESIGVKFARLRDTQIPERRLESIKMLLMFKLAGGEEKGWTIEKVIQHGKEMLQILGFGNDAIGKWEREQRGEPPEANQTNA